MKPITALEEWADIFYASVVGNPYIREKDVTEAEFDVLIERASEWAEKQKEQANGSGTIPSL